MPEAPRHWLVAALKVFGCIIIPLAGASAHTTVYFILVAWSLGGPRRSIEALTLSWLLNVLNPGIYNLSPYAGILRWVILATSFASVAVGFFRYRECISKTVYWVWAFAFVAAGLSFFASYAPDVSLFKITTFVIGATTVLLAFQLTNNQSIYWETWFLTFFIVICLVSFPLVFSPLGYLRNGRGYQGLFSHPQTFAVFIAPFVAWLTMLIIEKKDWRARYWFFLPVLVISIISLIATQSRTSALAAGGALVVVFAMSLSKQRANGWVLFVLRFILLAPVIAIAAWLNWSALNQSVTGFLLKTSGADNVAEAFYQSRGGGVEYMIKNFTQHPLTGIGFGIPSDPKLLEVARDPLFGLPVSAPVEKGFAVFAALEELGILGFGVLLGLLASIIAPVLDKHGGWAPTALSIATLLTNFGEAIFFAFGGAGLLVWLLIGSARVMKLEALK